MCWDWHGCRARPGFGRRPLRVQSMIFWKTPTPSPSVRSGICATASSVTQVMVYLDKRTGGATARTASAWFSHRVRPQCRGETDYFRFADDIVAGFQNRQDAEHVQTALGERLRTFKLRLAVRGVPGILKPRSHAGHVMICRAPPLKTACTDKASAASTESRSGRSRRSCASDRDQSAAAIRHLSPAGRKECPSGWVELGRCCA
jgi:hypothetical protein